MPKSKHVFQPGITLESINNLAPNTLVEALDIRITAIEKDSITATMPVDRRTVQYFGILHGGASLALAETVGSISAHCTLDQSKQYCVGLEINANHIKSVKDGVVTAISKPIHIGRTTQVWEIRITNKMDELICISRITLAVITK